jgi:hypothetical protein
VLLLMRVIAFGEWFRICAKRLRCPSSRGEVRREGGREIVLVSSSLFRGERGRDVRCCFEEAVCGASRGSAGC